MSNSSKALLGLLVAGTAGVVIVLFISLSGGKAQAECLPGERNCLPNVSYVDTTGAAYTPQSLDGKVVVVNFWATWCTPCLQEIPALSKVFNDHKKDGLVILGVMTDDPDNQALLNFQSDNLMSYPVVRAGSDIMMSYNYPRELPTTFIYDRHGKQVQVVKGGLSAAKLGSIIEPLL